MGGGIVAGFVKWIEQKALQAASGVVVTHSRFAEHVVVALGVDTNRVGEVRNWTNLDLASVTKCYDVRASVVWVVGETCGLARLQHGPEARTRERRSRGPTSG